ncbi:uncharacterized protein LOC100908864 [Galendromus occidentalis]|uniref:Uncharacterized protein LOC100908864 n=1 Tax=Galendromus occidentalis TaxID=34638 RepID=A0AAJ6VVH7_9ACAR|nr:uncharacterized protein LOC100908864 [Galendromus occidentalis]
MQAVRNIARRSLAQVQVRQAANAAANPNDRRMKYPYTLAAMMAQFPMRHYYKHAWFVRMMVPSIALTVLLFWKINQLVNSPGNIAACEERKRKEQAKKHNH